MVFFSLYFTSFVRTNHKSFALIYCTLITKNLGRFKFRTKFCPKLETSKIFVSKILKRSHYTSKVFSRTQLTVPGKKYHFFNLFPTSDHDRILIRERSQMKRKTGLDRISDRFIYIHTLYLQSLVFIKNLYNQNNLHAVVKTSTISRHEFTRSFSGSRAIFLLTSLKFLYQTCKN